MQPFPNTCTYRHTHKYTVIIQMQRYPPLSQLHSDFGDFITGVYHNMKIAIAESDLDTELLIIIIINIY